MQAHERETVAKSLENEAWALYEAAADCDDPRQAHRLRAQAHAKDKAARQIRRERRAA